MTMWREICVRVAKAQVERVEDILQSNGAVAVTISSAEKSEEIFDVLDNEFRLWRYVEVVGLFDEDFEYDGVLITLAAEGLAQSSVSVRELAEQDWVLRWQNEQRPLWFGNGLYLCPPNSQAPTDAKYIIELEPGMAFGTGTHATTAMCLQWIAAQSWNGTEIAIDFGCGSAVLAIAMAKCGAKSVYGCDIDPTAIDVSKQNIKINRTRNVSVSENTELPALKANVLVANILLEPLISEKPAILARTTAGARIVLSGILTPQVTQLIAAFEPEFELALVNSQEDWALVAGTKR